MPDTLDSQPKTALNKLGDEVRFLSRWLKSPKTVGAIAPSGPALARRQASSLPLKPGGKYLEIGPGTGVATQEILARGIPPRDLTLLEFSTEFCKLLGQRHPDVRIVQGDAYHLKKTLSTCPDITQGSLSGIVSGLPLLTSPLEERLRLIEEAFDFLEPGAPFVQFSYGLKGPVDPETDNISVEVSSWIIANLPPARVWIYRRPI